MATWYIVKAVTVSGVKLLPGVLIDDSQIATATIVAAGGEVWPSSDGTVAAMAAVAQASHANKGTSEADLEGMMRSATEASMKAAALADEANIAALQGAKIVHTTIDIPLTTIQAQTSGVAFNIGAALPANAQLVKAPDLNVIATVTGGSIASCTATIQNTAESAGALFASKSVFSATGRFQQAGSNPYATRGGQQLQMTLTAGGDTLANATTGHLAVELFYAVLT